MTCIAAVAQDGRVWMAADSAASNDYVSIHMDDPKVFILGELLIGVSGEHRINQVLRFGIVAPVSGPESDLEWLVCKLMPAFRECLRAATMLHRENDIERFDNSSIILLGYRGRLYRIEHDFCVISIADSYFATGSTMEYALGSLHATADMGMEPQERAVRAVKAAAYHGRGVREPITVTVVGPSRVQHENGQQARVDSMGNLQRVEVPAQ